jgi:hypothetical protein
MIRSLRKSQSSVYFQHENTGHCIGAERFECEVMSGDAVLRFSLRPSGSNQVEDMRYTLAHPVRSVQLDDAHVIDGLCSYLSHRTHEFAGWRLHVLTRTGALSLSVYPSILPHGGLTLTVTSSAG